MVNDDFIGDIVRFNPDIVGFSISTTDYHKTKNIIKRLKEKLPNALWSAGGIHPTVLPIETLEQLELDFVVIGEGEYVLRDVCENLESGKGLRGISGIIYKDNGKIIEGPPREFITNLDELPFPARHLIDFERYLVPPGIIRGEFIERLATVITSRGCPFKCIYCSSHKILGRKVRRRSVKNVTAEIDLLVSRYKVNGIWFLDDEFTLSKEWVFEFCEALRKKKYNLKWCCQTSLTLSNYFYKILLFK